VTREAGAGLRTVNAGCDVMNVEGDLHAASYSDLTPYYAGDAVAELRQVRGVAKRAKLAGGKSQQMEIDHSTLRAFARKRIAMADKTERDGRDLGAMVSMLTRAVQQLDARLAAIEGK